MTIEFIAFKHTVISSITIRQTERRFFTATANGNVGSTVQTCLIELFPAIRMSDECGRFSIRHILINGTSIHSWTPALACSLQRTIGQEVALISIVCSTCTELILQIYRRLIYISPFKSLINLDTQSLFSVLTALRYDYDSTIGTTRTVKSCSGSTFQNGNTLIIGRVQVLQLRTPVGTRQVSGQRFLNNHTIDNENRRVIFIN